MNPERAAPVVAVSSPEGRTAGQGKAMNLRRIAASLVAGAALATVITAGSASAAQAAAPQCDGGDRASAELWAASDDFAVAAEYTWVEGTAYNKVELRFNNDSQCAWGLYNGGVKASVYLEYEENGFTYQVDRQRGSESAYTGVWPDQDPRVMRACAADAGRIFCTDWF
jgi:hypothetical protein